MPAPTLDQIAQAQKRAKMGAKVSSDSAENLIVPRLPHVEIPTRVAKAYPELARWHQNNSEMLEQWREKVNTVLSRANSEMKSGTAAKIADLQTQITALTP